MKKAFGYIRVSGKGQVDGDGPVRQRKTITDFAKSEGFHIDKWFEDAGVSGTIYNRPALAEMMMSLEEDPGITTVVIERLDRLARDLIVQETIIADFDKHGVTVVSATDGEISDDPTRKLVRQIMGAIAEYDKNMTVIKLRVARERARKKNGKCEGRKSIKESCPEAINLIMSLRKKGMTFKKIATELNNRGFKTVSGSDFSVANVKMIWKRWGANVPVASTGGKR